MEPTGPTRRPGWFGRRTRPRVLAASLLALAVFLGVTARLFVWPATGMPARVSAIVMLAGPGDRLGAALRLAREHRAGTLVVSRGWHGYGGPCPAPVAGVRLICFEPDPGDTQGEAEFVARLARREGWRSLALVTTAAQDTRARMLLRRCYGGSVYAMTGPIPVTRWPYQIAYSWGALLKALLVKRSC